MKSFHMRESVLLSAPGLLSTQPWWVKFNVANSCITSIHATIATLFMNLFMSPLGYGSDSWAKRLTSTHRMHQPIHLIIEILFCWSLPFANVPWKEKYLHGFFLPIETFTKISLSLIFQPCSFQGSDYQSKALSPVQKCYIMIHSSTSGHSFLQTNWATG